MKATALLRYTDIDHPDAVFDTTLPNPPAPTGHDLLVRVHAVSVNQLDNRVRRPKDKVEPAPRVIGYDAAGIVQAVGPDVTLFQPGDAVYYSGDPSRPGSHAELQLVDERIVGRAPATLSMAEAAALPLASLTAWELLFDRLRVQPGRSILIVGAAGGVGSMAVQFAARVAQLEVIATASRPESAAWVRSMGAHHIVDHTGDIAAQLAAAGHPQVDYVVLLADTDRYFETAAAAVAPQGAIGLAVEATQPANIGLLWDKSVTLVWEMVYTRIDYRTSDLDRQHAILNQIAALFDHGVLASPVTSYLAPINATNLRAAHKHMASGRAIGKLVLEGFPA
ncbi:zinc-binding alcohol dehydrogenase family protein [Massilia arenosa]|uniref:Zinc-type alcohol dehydrogenase-like protein n=1 Tax=Zemynaea arenosa TaxID=2561931 RepID=A0A4Y9SE87_9BURK|nr:zinc-binding alcohol dehydrogenase family protein [Massilia arenosa]TFW21262.1 zinc-binding alcohol dehydrogenase family protein [Massilia arenosa]